MASIFDLAGTGQGRPRSAEGLRREAEAIRRDAAALRRDKERIAHDLETALNRFADEHKELFG